FCLHNPRHGRFLNRSRVPDDQQHLVARRGESLQKEHPEMWHEVPCHAVVGAIQQNPHWFFSDCMLHPWCTWWRYQAEFWAFSSCIVLFSCRRDNEFSTRAVPGGQPSFVASHKARCRLPLVAWTQFLLRRFEVDLVEDAFGE